MCVIVSLGGHSASLQGIEESAMSDNPESMCVIIGLGGHSLSLQGIEEIVMSQNREHPEASRA